MADPAGRLEPEFSERIDFSFPELFPSGDPLAPWLVNLARGANDLLLGNRRLVADLEAPPSVDPIPRNHEVIYDMKVVAADAWELAKFIRKNQGRPEVAKFVADRVPAEARADLRAALEAFDPPGDAPPNRKTFKRLLGSARDQASHYSEVDDKVMMRALRNLDIDLEGQPNETALFKGEAFKDFYAPFGTEMDWQLLHEMAEDQLESFKEFIGELNKMVGALVRFAATAIYCWFRDHEDSTRRSDLPIDEG